MATSSIPTIKISVVDQKILTICQMMSLPPTKITPKEFMLRYLISENSDLAYLRSHWGQPKGIESTMEVARALRNKLLTSAEGRRAWSVFIREEVIAFHPDSYK